VLRVGLSFMVDFAAEGILRKVVADVPKNDNALKSGKGAMGI
jgi:hypothetical protein